MIFLLKNEQSAKWLFFIVENISYDAIKQMSLLSTQGVFLVVNTFKKSLIYALML